MFYLTDNMFLTRDDAAPALSDFRYADIDMNPIAFEVIEELAEAYYGTPEAAQMSFEEHLWFNHNIIVLED